MYCSIEERNQPCVSIILPCYNVENYLREALDSVLVQTLTNIEIIPVDDGSPDNCADIIKEYADKDSRIKPIFKENGGYGTAVNAGLEVASGEYIAILEPDDYVMEDYYYILYHEAKKDDLDVCGVHSYCEVRDFEPPKLIQTPWFDNPDYMSFESINDYLANGGAGITLKIYKNSFLKDNQITLNNNLRAYHDVLFVTEVLDKASKCRIIIGTGYFYRKDNLMSTTKNKVSFYNIIDVANELIAYAHKTKRPSRKASVLGFCLKHLIFYYQKIIAVVGKNNSTEYIYDLIKKIVHYDKIRINSTTKFFLSQNFPDNLDGVEFTTQTIISFNQCSELNLEYLNSVYTFSTLISEQAFFTYYAITTKNKEQIEKIKNNINCLLSNFVGVKGRFISDFIEMYLSNGLLNYAKDWNQQWYIVSMNYMKKRNVKYHSRLYESLTHMKPDKSIIQFMPMIAGQFDTSFSTPADNLRKVKVIYDNNLNNLEKLQEFISNKSIAVVGNAPSEIGLKNGIEIDSHDIVIRFNNFSTEKKYSKDYGIKTNIWAVTPAIESLFFPEDYYDFDFILSPNINLKIPEERIKILYNYTILSGCFCYLESIGCRRMFNINVPSIGLYILFYLLENINKLGKVSLYGFSPLDAKREVRHYFNDDPAKTENLTFHDWDKEAIIIKELQTIFQKHNEGVK